MVVAPWLRDVEDALTQKWLARGAPGVFHRLFPSIAHAHSANLNSERHLPSIQYELFVILAYTYLQGVNVMMEKPDSSSAAQMKRTRPPILYVTISGE